MSKYILLLDFQNAGIFKKYWHKTEPRSASGDDRIFDGKNSDYRRKDQWIEPSTVTFHYSFIENVLRVLAGRRPVPKYRSSCVEHDDDIIRLAKNSYVKIDALVRHWEGKPDTFATETMTVRKASWNAWNQGCIVGWKRLENLLPEDLFNEFCRLVENIFGIDYYRKVTLSKVIEKIHTMKNDKRIISLCDRAVAVSCTNFKHLLLETGQPTFFQASYKKYGDSTEANVCMRTLTVKGIADVSRLDGMIGVPVTAEELEMFRKGRGFATLFDGGLVTINKVVDLEYSNTGVVLNGYTQALQ